MITQKQWQRMIDEAGQRVPLYDLPFAMRQFAWRYLGGKR